MVRTFVAIKIPDLVKEKVLDIQDELRNYNCRVSWAKAESIHLTLKFLGDTQDDLIDVLGDGFNEAVHGIAPFELETGEVGYFGGKRPRVLWIGFKESGSLFDIQSKIENAAHAFGFAKEGKSYHPHLTLGRVKESRGTFGMMEHFNSIVFPEQKFTVSEIIFYMSELKPSGAVHTPLRTIILK